MTARVGNAAGGIRLCTASNRRRVDTNFLRLVFVRSGKFRYGMFIGQYVRDLFKQNTCGAEGARGVDGGS